MCICMCLRAVIHLRAAACISARSMMAGRDGVHVRMEFASIARSRSALKGMVEGRANEPYQPITPVLFDEAYTYGNTSIPNRFWLPKRDKLAHGKVQDFRRMLLGRAQLYIEKLRAFTCRGVLPMSCVAMFGIYTGVMHLFSVLSCKQINH